MHKMHIDIETADEVSEHLMKMQSIVELMQSTPDDITIGTAKGCFAVLHELLTNTKEALEPSINL
ncbi:hypothetical protein [Zooshikella sp. RANM57]|uniref:hypothetical protein n=1 Tax=Zooshikella sp. RANM57 TaxID=3425863 RepID=UPI003D6F0363